MTIDFENQLSDKNAKLLHSSMQQMISAISKRLKENILDGDTINKFTIHFDNGNQFAIYIFVDEKDDIMFSKCKYINCYGKRQETISLQDALNINKYARDIEILLPKLQPNYILDAMISSTEDEQTKINIIQNPSTDSATLRRFVKKNQEFYQEHKDIFPEGFEIKRTKNRNTKDDLSEGTR